MKAILAPRSARHETHRLAFPLIMINHHGNLGEVAVLELVRGQVLDHESVDSGTKVEVAVAITFRAGR